MTSSLIKYKRGSFFIYINSLKNIIFKFNIKFDGSKRIWYFENFNKGFKI
jgi:hypothetical protein